MLALALAAAIAAPPQATDDLTRSVLTDVCLPYVRGEATDMAAAEFLGFAPAGEDGQFVSSDREQAFSLRLTTSGDAEEGDVSRTCVFQARRGGLGAVRAGAARPLEEAGFTADASQPAERPVWTKDGVTVSLRQNEGRSAVMRVVYSSLDEGA